MKIGIMQPYIFPYIGYFQTIKAVDTYVIYDDVQYIKGGWINRNNILIGGQKVLFTIRLADASPNKLINQIEIQDDFANFLKTISMAYAKAPYYEPVYELISNVCSYEDKNLARFIGNSIHKITEYLGIDTTIRYSSNIQKDATLKGQDKVIAICKKLNGTMYVNAIGGQSLYGREDFKAQNLELKFIKTGAIKYRQFKNDFVPWLSVIDVLMFNSPEEANKMLDDYELI